MAFVPAPGYQSVYNPPVPFTTPISGGMRPGMGFAIKATTTRDSNRFAMNFTTCEGDDSDMALHMQARYDGRDRVVFNSRKGGQWMTEEMKKDMPFKLGKVFEILVQITPNNYLIFANGERFYEFAHRIPIDQVQWLNVSGDVTVQHMAILGCGTGVKGGLVLTAAQANLIPMMGPPALLPPVPFKAFINGGMVPKRSVVVKGTPTGKSFSINLKSGYNGDIAFHLNPRMNKGTVVRNTFINNAWGKEELDITKNPFKQGESFEVDIRSAENKYKVFINGSHGFDFAYRTLNLAQVDTVEVTGDVKIDYVFF